MTHEELLNEPLALLILEDLDQPYTDYRGFGEEEREVPRIEGVEGLRNLLEQQ